MSDIEKATNVTNDQPTKTARDRPTDMPGGCDCERCGCIFIGAPSHQFCGVCIEIVAREIAERQQHE